MISNQDYSPKLSQLNPRYAITGLLTIPAFIGLVVAWLFPEIKETAVVVGLSTGVFLSGLVSLVTLALPRFRLDHDKLVRMTWPRKPLTARFDEIVAVQTRQNSPVNKTIVTRVFAGPMYNPTDAQYDLPWTKPHSSPILEMLKDLIGLRHPRYSVITIGSDTERYPELLAQILRLAPNAIADPLTRIIAGFAAYSDHIGSTAKKQMTARDHLFCFDLKRAQKILEKELSEKPEDSDNRHDLGLVYLFNGTWDQTVEQLKLASALKPEDPAILFHLGFALYANGDFHAAFLTLQAANRIKRLRNDEITFQNCSALHCGLSKQAEEADKDLERLVGETPVSGLARRCLACTRGENSIPDDVGMHSLSDKARKIAVTVVSVAIAALLCAVPLLARHGKFAKSIGGPMTLAVVTEFAKALPHFLKKREVYLPYPCWLDDDLTSINRKNTQALIADSSESPRLIDQAATPLSKFRRLAARIYAWR